MQSIQDIHTQINSNMTKGQLFFASISCLEDLASLLSLATGNKLPTPDIQLATDKQSIAFSNLQVTFWEEQLQLSGMLQQNSPTEQTLELTGTFVEEVAFDIQGISWFSLESLSFFLNSAITSFPTDKNMPDLSMPTWGLEGKIKTGKGTTLDVKLDFPNGSNNLWQVTGKLASGSSAGIDLLDGIGGPNSSWGTLIPSELSKLFQVSEVDLLIHFDPGAGTVPLIKLDIDLSSVFNISSHPNLALGDISLSFAAEHVLDQTERRELGRIKGTVELMQSQFSVEANFPGFYLTGSLDPATPLNLSQLLQQYAADLDECLPQATSNGITLSNLNTRIDVPNQSFWIHARSYMDWKPFDTVDFTLMALQLNLQLDFSSSTPKNAASLSASFMLDSSNMLNLRGDFVSGSGLELNGGIDSIPVGTLLTGMASTLGMANEVPAALASSELKQVQVSLNTSTKYFSFSGDGGLEIEGQSLDAKLNIELKHEEGGYQRTISGTLTIDEILFNFDIEAGNSNGMIVAQYNGSQSIALKTFVEAISPALGADCPDLSITVTNPYLCFYKTSGKAGKMAVVFGCSTSGSLQFSSIPIAGNALSKIKVEGMHLLYVSQDITKTELGDINGAISTLSPVPKALSATQNGGLAKGFQVSTTMDFGSILPPLHLSAGATAQPSTNTAGDAEQGSSDTTDSNAAVAKQSSNSNGNINHSFGPVHVGSISMDLSGGDLSFIIDASIAFGPLSMGFDHLKIGSPLSHFDPQASLDGLSLDFHQSDLAIEGAFLNEGGGEYSGMFTLAVSELQLTAFGSYKKLNDAPSLFIYGLLDDPLGGPPFFFVEGLAGAFGYNRNFIAPRVSEVASFPLVSVAANPASAPPMTADGITTMLNTLNTHIPPSSGDYFVGLGIKFNSFKLINSFGLLIIKFGKELEFDLLAESTYTAPDANDPNPVANVELAILGSFKPAEGALLVRGQLTPASFVFSKACHLQGGFAVACWLKTPHEGDFVYTFGGYARSFNPPANYPQHIPRLGFNWRVDSDVSIKGGGFWAITPRELMLGGFLKAAYRSSWVHASFDIDAEFMVEWSPFHYQGDLHISISIHVRIKLVVCTEWLGFDMSIGLKIWGPPFGGEASVDLDVATVHIHFGSDPAPAPLLSGFEFNSAFLPQPPSSPSKVEAKNNPVVAINIEKGLLRECDGIAVVNPKELQLSTNSVVPATSVQVNGKNLELAEDSFEIVPMGELYGANNNHSEHNVKVQNENGQNSSQFTFSTIEKNAPRSMWSIQDQEYMDQSLNPLTFGVQIKPVVQDSQLPWGAMPLKDLTKLMLNGPSSSWNNTPQMTPGKVSATTAAESCETISSDLFSTLNELFNIEENGKAAEFNGLKDRLQQMGAIEIQERA